MLDHAAIPLGDYRDTSNLDLLEAYTILHAEIGDLAAAIRSGLEDGDLSRREFNKIQKEGQEMIQAWLELRARLEALVNG